MDKEILLTSLIQIIVEIPNIPFLQENYTIAYHSCLENIMRMNY